MCAFQALLSTAGLLLCLVGAAPASTPPGYSFAAVATTFDFDAHIPQRAIGHFNFSDEKSKLIVDVPNYDDYANVIESDMMGPWVYVLITSIGEEAFVSVFDLKAKNKVHHNSRCLFSYL
jgi:hypothetical protein